MDTVRPVTMTQLTDLPEEIIIMIIRLLDFCSLQSMYNACTSFRNIVCLHGVIKECNMSRNTLATAKTLQSNLFKDLSNHLLKLNMCGVPDLCKTKVLPPFKKLKSLTTLDISYTNLNILDLVEIHNICPTVKDVTINFVFGPPGRVNLSQKNLKRCQLVFEHFEKVHFIGSLDMLFSSMAVLNILKTSKLNTLKLSAVEYVNAHFTILEQSTDCQLPYFDYFAAYLINWNVTNMYTGLNKFPVMSMIQFKNYEYVIMCTLNKRVESLYATEIFKKFFSENFGVNVECPIDCNECLVGNVAIMIWNKETTKFDDLFFHKLFTHVKQYFIFHYKPSDGFPQPAAPQKYDWFFIEPSTIPEFWKEQDDELYLMKRSRKAMPNLLLNYDNLFLEKRYVQLSLDFNGQMAGAITLSANSDYLRKLTFLSLSGSCYYHTQFFNILFRCCENLVTLSVESPNISSCALPIQRSIALSRSLKNIRLVDKCIDLGNIFTSFSQCNTLENIHLRDQRNWDHNDIADPSVLVEKCTKLYCVFIHASLTATGQTKLLQLFNKAVTRCDKHYLKAIINQVSFNSITFKYDYDPFLDVFKLNPIKPI